MYLIGAQADNPRLSYSDLKIQNLGQTPPWILR